MAVYEYACEACGHRFEVKVPMSQYDRLKAEPPACPACGNQQTQQVVALFSCKPASNW